MRLALFMIMLLAGPAAAQTPPVPTQAEAEALAAQGNREAALQAFQRRAAADPGDLTARLWIGKLHEQMGHPDLAEPVYRSVMLESPDNVEAMLGVGTSLISLERGDEALLVLDRAAKLAPKNAAVLEALGQAHLQASNIKLGISYLELAATIDPTYGRAVEQARREYGHHIVASAFFEQFNGGLSDTGSGSLAVDLRVADRVRVLARGQYQHKFGISDQRGGGGIEWRPAPRTTVVLYGLAGPNNQVLPEADARLFVRQRTPHAAWTFGYRYLDFQGARASVVSPGVEWLGPGASIGFTYSLTLTNYDGVPDAEDGHSAAIDGAFRLDRRFWIRLGYVYGVEDFDSLSRDRLGRFKAHTVRGGFRLDMATATSLLGLYEYQHRLDDVNMNRVSVVLAKAF